MSENQRVVACIIEREARLLVCQRPSHKRHGGLWEFPGGKAEAGESDVRAAARELDEELGVRLLRADPAIFEIADPASTFVIAFVPVEIVGEPRSTEHPDMIWAAPHQLARLPLAPSDRAFADWFLTRRSGNEP